MKSLLLSEMIYGFETMTTTIDLDEKAYGQLLRRALPHVIRTGEQHARLTDELLRLDQREEPTPEEQELAELLTVLIDEYEERRYSHPQGQSAPGASASDGSPQPHAKRPLENLRFQRNYVRGFSRQAFD
ncbi:MAG TPA: hypothetical protein VEI73_06875 [Candidatus Acidoferrum sp.]|nr:hypothetical protein [Candidatus Acidoferrum sp.]